MVLRIEGLRVETQSGVVLVDGVDLELARGEVLGLIGESGAGKSTIGLAALTFARPGCRIAGGRIVLQGTDLRSLDAQGRGKARGVRVAYVAQSAAAAFNPAMSLLDQVTEGPVRHGLIGRAEARQKAIEAFRALDLPDPEHFGERYPHQVSGGQLQRAMAAMAISCSPDVLVLDEPTTALDVTTQIEMLAHLKQLIALYGTAALYISHDLAVVAQIADRIMVLRHGKMVEVGTATQILTAPGTDYARALVAERIAAGRNASQDTGERAEPLLAIEDLTVRFGSREAVKAARFTISKGETVAVVGESGSGKTTLSSGSAQRYRAPGCEPPGRSSRQAQPRGAAPNPTRVPATRCRSQPPVRPWRRSSAVPRRSILGSRARLCGLVSQSCWRRSDSMPPLPGDCRGSSRAARSSACVSLARWQRSLI